MKVGLINLLMDREPGTPRRYSEIRDFACRAEDLGFDSVWVYDHLIHRFPEKPPQGIWECWTVLSALAEATSGIELGTLVVCTPFRNPALIAKMAVTLDEVSEGRFILGLGAGWHQPEFDAFGFPFDHRVSRFAEALQIVNPLLKAGQVDFAGQFYQARDCEILPRGPRPNGPPLMIAAAGPKMVALAAEHADIWATGANSPTALNQRQAVLATAGAEVGRDVSKVDLLIDLDVDYPDLDVPTRATANPDALSGSGEEIAARLAAFRDAGLANLVLKVNPSGHEAMARLAKAVEVYRAS